MSINKQLTNSNVEDLIRLCTFMGIKKPLHKGESEDKYKSKLIKAIKRKGALDDLKKFLKAA